MIATQAVLGIGQQTDVTLKLDNTGGAQRANVVITATLGSALTGTIDPGSPCTQTGNSITCTVGTLQGEPRARPTAASRGAAACAAATPHALRGRRPRSNPR